MQVGVLVPAGGDRAKRWQREHAGADNFTDIGAGATYQSTYLDVSRWNDRAP